jgi:hypothetical protein
MFLQLRLCVQQGKGSAVYLVCAEELQRRELRQPVQFIAGSQFCTGLQHASRAIAIVNIRYQETSSESIAEEQPWLRAVTKQWLVKADWEDLAWSDL